MHRLSPMRTADRPWKDATSTSSAASASDYENVISVLNSIEKTAVFDDNTDTPLSKKDRRSWPICMVGRI